MTVTTLTRTHEPVDLSQVTRLYDEGRYLAAYRQADALGPLTKWTGAAGRLIAGRMANNLGAPRLGDILHWLAFREHPEDPSVQYFYAFRLLTTKGPLAAWNFMRARGALESAPVDVQAHWAALWASVLSALRDFERADHWLCRAEQVCAAERPWILVEKAHVLQCQDRFDEALTAALDSLQIHSFYRPAVQAAAHLLVQLNQDDEAIVLLEQASEQLESGLVIAQLAALQTELGRYQDARSNYERAGTYLPLTKHDKEMAAWLASRRSDAAYYCGDLAAAARFAAEVKHGFFEKIATRLAAPTEHAKMILLPVGFVRQHRDTCAPATLAAISSYWSRPADHLEVVSRICYDGTPAHSERHWAEESGFVTREFRVTWESAVALLDRGVPFTLTTVAPGCAHLQAVIGYDTRRGTLLIRDPSERHFRESLAEELFEACASTGPRGMALVPVEQAELLADLELPDAEAYDDYYQLELALERHDRDAAEQVLRRMAQREPESRLTIYGRLALSRYDNDESASLANLEKLLERYPRDTNLLVARLAHLRNTARRADRMRVYEQVTADPKCDPLLWLRFAEELWEDARQLPRVESLLQRTLRERPCDGQALGMLADLRWQQQQREDALELYRFTACSNDKIEGSARSFFLASCFHQRSEDALQLLRDRFDRFGARSNWPTQTLCWAYEQLDQATHALQVCEEALALRPEDGELALFAADTFARFGRRERAAELLEQAQSYSHRTTWLRTAASLALYDGHQERSLGLWLKVLAAEPLSADAHDAVARLLADTAGVDAAIQHLRDAVARFPHNRMLRGLLIQWLRDQAPDAEAAIREYLDLQPTDPWAQRELAVSLIHQGLWEEAEQAARTAQELDPTSPVVHLVRSRVLVARGDVSGAKEACRQAARLSIDYEGAMEMLLSLCDTKADRQQELRFLSGELRRQTSFSDGLLVFRDLAARTLPADEILGLLMDCLRQRPETWQVWAALITQLVEMEHLEDAQEAAASAVERFPLLPRMWLELASVCAARQDTTGRVAALQRAVEINSTWDAAARELAEAYTEQERCDEAREVLERAIRLSPRDVRNHGMLAQLLWQMGEQEVAAQRVQEALLLEPGYEWGWQAVRSWGPVLNRPQMAFELAQQLVERRPAEARSWFVLAESCLDLGREADALYALDRAIDCNPRLDDAHALKASVLCSQQRFDEALVACRPEVYGESTPLQLRARAADVLFQRGSPEDAIAAMQDVVGADPDYYWAWGKLADWWEAAEDHAQQLVACQNLVRIAPKYAIALGYLAAAEVALGQPDEAVAHLEAALECDPAYAFAARSLIDLHLAQQRFPDAERVLERVAGALPEDLRLALEVSVRQAQDDKVGAVRAVSVLCNTPQGDGSAMHLVCESFFAADWMDDLDQTLEAHLRQDEPNPHAARAFVDVCLHSRGWDACARRVGAFQGQAWTMAVEQLLAAVQLPAGKKAAQKFIRRHKKKLRQDNHTWATVGKMLYGIDPAETIRWLSDWKKRAELRPCMLLPLAAALWWKNRSAGAVAVSRAACELPADDTTSFHYLWLALDAGLRGKDTSPWLDHVNPADARQGFYGALFVLVTTLTDSASSRAWTFTEARHQMRQACRPDVTTDELLPRLLKRCLWRLAKNHRRRFAQLWHWLAADFG